MTRKERIFSCCHECKEKFEGCHGVCSTFLQAQEEWRVLQETIREAKYHRKLYETYHRDRVAHQCRINRNKNGR